MAQPHIDSAAIKYLVTAYIDASGKFSDKRTDFTIHDVVQITEGTLADCLCLLPYRLADIFTLLNLDRELRKTDKVMERLANFPKIISGSMVVIHEENLYGVVIKNTVPEVVGIIRHMFTSINKKLTENCLVLKGNASNPGQMTVVDSRKVNYEPKSNVLITIPLGGHCFVQCMETNDGSGDEDAIGQSELALLVGTSFLLVDNVALNWVKFKDRDMKQTELTSVDFGKVLFMYSGGCVREGDGFTIHGLGPRKSNYNEAFYYALMHWGESFNHAPANVV